ncbi:hypothetical protein ACFPVY_17040 [Flavobacterium qiangtangense]|uniref:Uncharacterized protein n=1 Tax=Flavobacterium qiangtangense TaxID=1442595 RepID=A0ABW1PTC0_9FLAO
MQKNNILYDKINQNALREIYDELPDSFINFTDSDIMDYCLHQIKVGTKSEQSARVLNSWINNDIIFVNEADKGKIRRFDRLESIWLSIIIEARKFGIPLESLKQTRKDLTESPIQNFSLLKFSVLDTILRVPKTLLIFEGGFTNIMSLEIYTHFISKGLLPTHINFKLQDFIALEFPNNAFELDFKIQDAYENTEKMTLLYFLKTGDYKSIKLHIKEGDVRLIEDSNLVIKNMGLMNAISSWSFNKAEIFVDDGVTVTITS